MRNQLLLTHWGKIKPEYDIVPNTDVAKMIQELSVTNPVKHDELYSDWSSRYSDLPMKWEKKRDSDTNIIYGTLVAAGRLRFKGLEDISKGCSIVLMKGKLNSDPLPTSKVPALRVTHMNLQIDFPMPIHITNPDSRYNFGSSYRVGRNNALYSAELREDNLKAIQEKEEEKQDKRTKNMLDSLLKNFLDLTVEHKRRTQEEQNGGGKVNDDDKPDDDEESVPSQGRGSGFDNSFMSPTNSGFDSYPPLSRSSPADRAACIDLAKQFTLGSKTPHSNQVMPGITDTEAHKIDEARGGETNMQEPPSSPKNNAGDDQVY